MQGIFFGLVWSTFAKMHRNNIIMMTFFQPRSGEYATNSYFFQNDYDAAFTDGDSDNHFDRMD